MKLEVQLRDKSGKSISHKLRRDGMVPGIVYGGKVNYRVSLSEKIINQFIQAHHSSKKIFELEIDDNGKKESKTVLLQEYQRAIYKNIIEHVDFREVTPDTMLDVEIPIHTVGNSKAVKLGGVLQVIRHSIPVKCRAADIVDFIEIDVTDLDFGESVHVLDIAYPKGITPVVTGRNFTLLTVGDASAQPEPEETAAEEAVVAEEDKDGKEEDVKK